MMWKSLVKNLPGNLQPLGKLDWDCKPETSRSMLFPSHRAAPTTLYLKCLMRTLISSPSLDLLRDGKHSQFHRLCQKRLLLERVRLSKKQGHVPMRVEAENVQEIMVEQKAHTQFVFCFLCGQVSPRLLLRLHQMLFRLFPLVYPLQMRNPLQKKLLLKRQPRTQKKG